MNILKIWQHPESRSTPTVIGPRYLITTISFVNLLVSCAYLITNLRLGINPRANLVQICGSAVTLACLRLFRSHSAGAHVFLGMAIVNACSLVFTFIDFPYTIVIWMPVFTILAVYIAGLMAGGFWSLIGITSVAVIILWGKEWNAHPVPIAPQDLPAITVMTLYLTGVTAFIGSMFFARSIHHLLRIQERQNEELKEQNRTIQAYAQDKAMLASIVVHDIATPLTVILHSCEAAMKEPQSTQGLPRIQKAAEMIQAIARSVREYQSVESGRTPVRIEAVDLHTVFDHMRFVLEDALLDKSLELKIETPEDGPLLVLADEESLSNSVFSNLIFNAIKFSHPGQTIEVSARIDGDAIEVDIRDFGVGMSEARIEALFSGHGPRSSKGTRGEKGSGYGLAIAKAYLDKYGAEMRVASREEKLSPDQHGTTITLRLRRVVSSRSGH